MIQPNMRFAKLLIVEDSKADIALMKQFFTFEKISNDIHYVRSLAEARALLAKSCFDICLIDIHLPDGDGLELVHELDTERTNVVMLSGQEDMAQLLKAQHLGAVAYMAKPLSKAMLDRLVKELRHLHWAILVEKKHAPP